MFPLPFLAAGTIRPCLLRVFCQSYSLFLFFPAINEYQQQDNGPLHNLAPGFRDADNGQKVIQDGHNDSAGHSAQVSAFSATDGCAANNYRRDCLCIIAGAYIQETGPGISYQQESRNSRDDCLQHIDR